MKIERYSWKDVSGIARGWWNIWAEGEPFRTFGNQYIRGKQIATLTREVFEVPNSTVSIEFTPSVGRVEQLAGLTNISASPIQGINVNSQIFSTQVVGTSVYSELSNQITVGQATYLSAARALQEFGSEVPNPLADPNLVTFDIAQQQTALTPVDCKALAEAVIVQKSRLNSLLDSFEQLQPGWDGEGAPSISSETIKTAEAIAETIFSTSLAALQVATCRLGPLADGSLRFECVGGNKELFISVSGMAVEVQAWEPLTSVESVGFWETDAAGAKERIEWLLK
jgi:hypothetical protein